MKLKSEKGSVTLFVLVSCLFFLTSVACINMYISSKQSAVTKEYQQIKKNYEQDLSPENVEKIYNNLKNQNSIVSFGKPHKSYKNKELFVPITLNKTDLDIKSIKYGWIYSQESLSQSAISSGISNIEVWTYIEDGTAGLNFEAKTSCTNDGFYYLCFMLDDKPYWTNGIKSNKIQIQVGNTVQEITEDTDLDTIYGQKVTNYAKDGDNTTYRIFYIDFDGKYGDLGGIYLKADYDDTRRMNLSSYTSYNPINTSVLEKMNSGWAENRLQYKDSTSDDTKWNGAEHGVAYLCDPTTSDASSNQSWASYFNSINANYVIGTPSVEIYVGSYNDVTHTMGNFEYDVKYNSTPYPGYSYKYREFNSSEFTEVYYTPYNSIDYLGYWNMYFNSSNRGSFYLSSPSSCKGSAPPDICGVHQNAYLSYFAVNNSFVICPLVSLKSTFTPIIARNLPDQWTLTASTNKNNSWYEYKDIGNNTTAIVNAPSLMGNMNAIKYTGNVTTSKWANAMTTDGSMWVWIPRYAYKITSGYHTNSSTGGTIEIKFLKNGTNEFWDGTNETVLTDPSQVTYTDNVQNEWLVHPAFTANADNGGGFGEIPGFWFAKFEISGTKTVENDVITAATFKSVAGDSSLREVSIGDFYKYARQQLYGETGTSDTADGFTYTSFGQSHIVKNSEWGAVAYLAQSAYGANGAEIEGNITSYITGGNNNLASIYSTNAGQSTTKNAYGVYDMYGTSFEYVASYINNGNTYLTDNTSVAGMLTSSNVGTNSKYKTLYDIGSDDSRSLNYSANLRFKGDGIWETSNSSADHNSWFLGNSFFPKTSTPFFKRSNYYNSGSTGIFSFYSDDGQSGSHSTSRLALVTPLPLGT